MNSELTDWTSHIQSNSWFFGIGIDHYLDFPNLHNAVKDVQDIKTLLLRKYDIEEDRVVTIFNEEATEDNIKGRLQQLTTQLQPHDKLIIYYSGHGHLSATNRGYWISHDAQRGNPSRYISNADIRTYLEDSPAKHILLISDSCFSGSLFQAGRMRSTRSVDELEKRASRWGLCSGRGDEEVWDGEPGQNSPFAKSIIEALDSNDIDGWNVSRLVEVVTEQTAAHTRQLPQGSALNIHGHKGGQYVFRLKSTASPIGSSVSDPISLQASEFTKPENDATTEVTEIALGETSIEDQQATSFNDSKLSSSRWNYRRGDSKGIGRIFISVFAAVAGLAILTYFLLPGLFGGDDIAQLELHFESHSSGFAFAVEGGVPEYTWSLAQDDIEFYVNDLQGIGSYEVLYQDLILLFPGDYTFTVEDADGAWIEQSFTIDTRKTLSSMHFIRRLA